MLLILSICQYITIIVYNLWLTQCNTFWSYHFFASQPFILLSYHNDSVWPLTLHIKIWSMFASHPSVFLVYQNNGIWPLTLHIKIWTLFASHPFILSAYHNNSVWPLTLHIKIWSLFVSHPFKLPLYHNNSVWPLTLHIEIWSLFVSHYVPQVKKPLISYMTFGIHCLSYHWEYYHSSLLTLSFCHSPLLKFNFSLRSKNKLWSDIWPFLTSDQRFFLIQDKTVSQYLSWMTYDI